MFLTSGRSARYHTPQDTPEHLDHPKMPATARWLERFVRASCERPEPRVGFLPSVCDDASTLRSIDAMTAALEPIDPRASVARQMAMELSKLCDGAGRLPSTRRSEAAALIGMIEAALR